ncbi:non-hydrolyzing UDP-N-acetylglucosamine 2-epimerase [Rhizobium ruizarguesonis]|jgi:UDP-N-acetylglucosamine 2-epimerase (non-hydrolysing)|uniref:non-hydrolyzing UDP-N-acetylglucosamine 2-epimerase n=1 Tax=Rhizobium ruizarguesonis TaxID=2081791 RepID=UPI00102F4283|nr:UDP-N-acetylglucosamine 2-epimerase (non-hydrolyzing) [Rhizobium ruizarguesonis]TAU25146.1 UDP-N-acetylglucosamine 2-epimerase (non-hydrolyzing) [Rhizobium ruizarguesonis]TAU66789.1 UDP-N-acetylglucosamine 2-epimerase (non-hydrolyzing) [Rhizobium ruizarguesonis]TAW08540.1 UDP-N-acetylglucosamine 2-epimerase (non-hydrolyzing) [Rhizobium ruizarguesonis]TAY77924.1 UDP-N-acetylglucosamine 2-epimerase (non-hydrolyzing) [Rhizobium ruizarguesonis]TAZ33431.1 UDP-N-acetylglucosamine 2-epimerase (non
MRKVMTIVGTRPELIKMSRVIAELDQHTNHVLVHTGQNYDYELNQIFFDDLGIRKPDHFLEAVGENAAQTIARVIEKADLVLEKEQPEAVLLYGDTNSCLAVIAAKRRKIPVFHMEAGNRCFDQRVPEELNRKVLDHLSDINLVLTEHARRYLIAEGIRPETIIKTGSHMREVLDFYMPKIKESEILQRLALETGRFFIVSAHREENVDSRDNLRNLIETLNALAEAYDMPIVVSTHPRTHKRMETTELMPLDPRLHFLKPFGFTDYVRLQMEALCVISDSGTITEESSLLNLAAITIRNAHERPEGMDVGTLIMAGLTKERVLDAVRVIVAEHDKVARTIAPVADYEVGAVSKQILRVVLSYIDYVNRTVWSKPE